jgi:hypothetical protein
MFNGRNNTRGADKSLPDLLPDVVGQNLGISPDFG